MIIIPKKEGVFMRKKVCLITLLFMFLVVVTSYSGNGIPTAVNHVQAKNAETQSFDPVFPVLTDRKSPADRSFLYLGSDNDYRKISNQSIMAVLWSQTAAENKALYYQGFNIGKNLIDESLNNEDSQKKRAIVLDIDETVLDNSPYFAYLIERAETFPFHWDKWINSASAKPLPGALDFLHDADSKGIAIFYVSNRDDHLLKATIENLIKFGFPQVDESHVILKSADENKGARREVIEENYTIIALFGDNLGDFSDVFNGKEFASRIDEADKLKEQYGSKFVVFPNPMYGNWEWTLYNDNLKMKPSEKIKARKESLTIFEP